MEEEANQLYRRPQMTGQARDEEEEEEEGEEEEEEEDCRLMKCTTVLCNRTSTHTIL